MGFCVFYCWADAVISPVFWSERCRKFPPPPISNQAYKPISKHDTATVPLSVFICRMLLLFWKVTVRPVSLPDWITVAVLEPVWATNHQPWAPLDVLYPEMKDNLPTEPVLDEIETKVVLTDVKPVPVIAAVLERIEPSTSSFWAGAVVPMPTLPVLGLRQ